MRDDTFNHALKIRGENTVALVVTCPCGTTLADLETADLNIDKVRANPEHVAAYLHTVLFDARKDRGVTLTCETCGRIVPPPPNPN